MTNDELLRRIDEAVERNLTELDLSEKKLSLLPPEIVKHQNLTSLDLSCNKLRTLPWGIGELQNLTSLDLSGNQLPSVPPEFVKLQNLTSLDLSCTELRSLPPEIFKLQNLTELKLSFSGLRTLPPEIVKLQNLKILGLQSNGLTSLPPEFAKLQNLKTLGLRNNGLTSLPPEITKLQNLTSLDLSDNQLPSLPPEIAKLQNLKTLGLQDNGLTSLPPEFAKLQNLTGLLLAGNQLTSLPLEITKLQNLKMLDLPSNGLTSLPSEIARLQNLTRLYLGDNPDLQSPPPAIVEQGTEAVLAYLRERLEATEPQWVSKLLLVGEGGVGKTSLLNVLDGKPYDAEEAKTPGIEIRPLGMAHPEERGVTMTLNAWDFGGQPIYHATHQFFLSGRSLVLLLWDTRHGFEAGKLRKWLDTIHARAPGSPVLIVGAHLDEHNADIPIAELRAAYPQIAGDFKVSNRDGTGIDALRAAVAEAAAGLPLMGEPWPADWLKAAEALRGWPQHWIRPAKLAEVMTENGVKPEDVRTVARYLHDLGDILYFQDDEDEALREMVILKPQWVSGYVCRVLDSDDVVDGILEKPLMQQLWADLDPALHGHFLLLMERFDLSYRTLENREISIVVEKLSQDAPAFKARWEALAGRPEVGMRFELNTIPAGIPTYFIARTHRFSTHLHWLYGALFSDGKDPEHLGLVRSFPQHNRVELRVRGPYPQNFFALLKDGFEQTLERFPGLDIRRVIPCPGHDGAPCPHTFRYEHLLKRLERRPPMFLIECNEAMEKIDIRELLFGLAPSTREMILDELAGLKRDITALAEAGDRAHEAQLSKQNELLQLAHREFTRAFNRDQSCVDSHCPSVFAIRSRRRTWGEYFNKIPGLAMDLQLYCQAPGEWHPVEAPAYEIVNPAAWLLALAPHLRKLLALFRQVTPLGGLAVDLAMPNLDEIIAEDAEHMHKFIERLPPIQQTEQAKAIEYSEDPLLVEGAELRALRKLLDEVDPPQHWGGLRKIHTPEGHYLWLCPHHAEEYRY